MVKLIRTESRNFFMDSVVEKTRELYALAFIQNKN